jgi:Tol biopolymer transport system component
MELVEGEDLSQRIARGPIPIDEALAIARQIADALEAAHEQGIIHRDLKPANIKLRDDGTVKVLDFGLAKALDSGPSPTSQPSSPLANSPTITSPAMTQAGIILGTAAYMAPEQAKGKPATKRSDIWAFGCVLYEMLTGRRAFEGEDISDTLAAVLHGEPDWSRLPPSTPPSIHRLLRRALVRDPRARLADIADGRLELDAPADPDGRTAAALTSTHAGWRERLVWLTAVVLAAATAAVVGRSMRSSEPSAPEMRVDIVTPPSVVTQDQSLALSPDGRRLVFVADEDKRAKLFVRTLDSTVVRPMRGTEGARYPFWSDDGRSVGFFTATQLKTIDIETTAVTVLSPVVSGGGGTWRGNTIIFSANSGSGPLYRVDASGGAPIPVTRLESAGAVAHRHPYFLPDGRHFLYLEVNSTQVRVGDLDGTTSVPLLESDAGAEFADGHLLFVRQGRLLAQTFDPERLALSGTFLPLVDQVSVDNIGRGAYSAALRGAIAYRSGSNQAMRQFVWYERDGRETERVSSPVINQSNPELSPDGSRVALQRNTAGNTDLWVLDLARGAFNRITSDPGIEALPVWSPNGRSLVFNSSTRGRAASTAADSTRQVSNLWMMAADGSEEGRLVVASDEQKWASDWSRDGRWLLYRSLDPRVGTQDVWVTGFDGSSPRRVVSSAADERDAQFSPDGRWIAYQSDESNRYEIYIQRFPGPGGKERISTDGGVQPRWRSDGREIFFITPDFSLAAAEIALPPSDGPPTIKSPRVLFPTRMVPGGIGIARQQYVVSRDGQRFLINAREAGGEAPSPVTLLLNWRNPGRSSSP